MTADEKQNYFITEDRYQAEKIKTVKKLEWFLCSLAKPEGMPADISACMGCESPCGYGKKYVQMVQAVKQKE